MKSLELIRSQLIKGEFEFSQHAFKRAVERNISDSEIREIGFVVIVIETYPDDKYSPSYLLFGRTQIDRLLHIQVSMMDSTFVKIITLYEPDPEEWIDFVARR